MRYFFVYCVYTFTRDEKASLRAFFESHGFTFTKVSATDFECWIDEDKSYSYVEMNNIIVDHLVTFKRSNLSVGGKLITYTIEPESGWAVPKGQKTLTL